MRCSTNGQVQLEVYEGHTYELDAQAPGYEMVVKEVPINGDTEVTFTLPMATDEQTSQTNSTTNESAAA